MYFFEGNIYKRKNIDDKLKEKLKNNKMRIGYLLGFATIFSMSYLYDSSYLSIKSSFNQKCIINPCPFCLKAPNQTLFNSFRLTQSTIQVNKRRS